MIISEIKVPRYPNSFIQSQNNEWAVMDTSQSQIPPSWFHTEAQSERQESETGEPEWETDRDNSFELSLGPGSALFLLFSMSFLLTVAQKRRQIA